MGEEVTVAGGESSGAISVTAKHDQGSTQVGVDADAKSSAEHGKASGSGIEHVNHFSESSGSGHHRNPIENYSNDTRVESIDPYSRDLASTGAAGRAMGTINLPLVQRTLSSRRGHGQAAPISSRPCSLRSPQEKARARMAAHRVAIQLDGPGSS